MLTPATHSFILWWWVTLFLGCCLIVAGGAMQWKPAVIILVLDGIAYWRLRCAARARALEGKTPC